MTASSVASCGALLAVLAAPAASRASVDIKLPNAEIRLIDLNAGSGTGFEDSSPPDAVNNPGQTRGEQALNAFKFAAELWAKRIDSKQPIVIEVSFQPLFCDEETAVLGSAGPKYVVKNFPGAEYKNTWYHVALANKLAFNEDLVPAGADIRARFNSELGKEGCLTGNGWYLGLDTNEPATQINLVNVLLHEFAHGLGFSSTADSTTGKLLQGKPDVYSSFYFDVLLGRSRLDMNNVQRQFSAINTGSVVWTGANVKAAAPQVLGDAPALVLTLPDASVRTVRVGTGAFSGPITEDVAAGEVVPVIDVAEPVSAAFPAGGNTADGCSSPSNAAALVGKIALVNRGNCSFNVKAANAQLAGAKAVIIADNRPASVPPGMAGAPLLQDPIPALSVTQADGASIRAQVPGIIATFTVALGGVYPGTDLVQLYAPAPVEPGSSISHWDTTLTPNQLMEPFINDDLTFALDVDAGAPQGDLTMALMRDIGWYPDADLDRVRDVGRTCPVDPNKPATVVVNGIDTGVKNSETVDGCTIGYAIAQCADGTHGAYTSCVTDLASQLAHDGYISTTEQGAIVSAVALHR